ncbi:MAG: alpha/beta-hydrolase N-terminal domain-containing protein, partial [Candidatus Nanopelagicales bacterium]
MSTTVTFSAPAPVRPALRRLAGALSRAIPRIRTAPSLPPVRAGVISAAWSVAGSYARGLLPRSASDQAMATGVVASTHYLLTATSAAAIETVALYASGDHGVHDRRPPANAMLSSSLGFLTAGLVIERALPPHPDEPMQRSLTRFAGHFLMTGGAATILVTATDEVLGRFPLTSRWRNRTLLVDLTLASGLAALGVYQRRRRAQQYGLVDPDRPAVELSSAKATVRAVGVGAAAGVGLLTVAGTEQIIARRVTRTMNKHVGRVEIGSPWLGHAVAVSLLGAAGVFAFSRTKRRIEHGGDVIEAAYPEPPTSEYVTAGPKSLIDFDTIGKEGRR